MSFFLRSVFLAFLFFSSGVLYASTSYHLCEFRDLSDRRLSAEGENALKINKSSWKHAESEHFVYHFTDEKEAETVLIHAEMYFGWIQKMFGIRELPAGRKSHIFIFNEEKLWDEFRHRGTLERIAGAEAFTDGNELFIHRAKFWLEPQRILAHELTHVILYRLMGDRVPLFLNEGYAEYIGYKAVAMKFDGDEFSSRTIKKISDKYYQKLSWLSAARVYPKGLEETASFYLQCELFVRYLIERHGAEKFYDFLKSMVQSKSLAYSLRQIYQLGLDTVERDFKRYALEPKS